MKKETETPLYMGPVTAANGNNNENVHMCSKKEKKCIWNCMLKLGKKLHMDVTFAMYT